MTTINFSSLKLSGPSQFSALGPNNTTYNFDASNLLDDISNISGGAILSGELHVLGVDPVVYATAVSPSTYAKAYLQNDIEIGFILPVNGFQVEIFNGTDTVASYQVKDNFGNSAIITLNPATGAGDFGYVTDPAQGIVSITIQSVTSSGTPTTGWNFSIDNIIYNFSPGEAQIVKANPSVLIENDYAIAANLNLSLVSIELEGIYGENSFSDALAYVQAVGLVNCLLVEQAYDDPFDPNYNQVYEPTFVQIPTIQPGSMLTQQAANDANTALSDFSNAFSYLQALLVTMNRLNSAEQVGDQASVNLQSAELDQYMTLSSYSLAAAAKDLAIFNGDVSLNLTVTPQDINNFLSNLNVNGFSGLPQQEQSLFNLLGLSTTDEQNIVNELLSVNASNVPSSLAAALQQDYAALDSLASIYGVTTPANIIQNEYLGIVRTTLPFDQAITASNAIATGTETQAQYVAGLLSQVADTTAPAVAIEGSMYGAVGSFAEITSLVTNFLPGQITYATQLGVDLTVFACQSLGLVFAFGNENGATTFSTNFGPSNPSMPNTAAGDAAFAAAACTAIFGSQSTQGEVNFVTSHITYWINLYTEFGLPGFSNPTASQIDLAARGAVWGEVLGVGLDNNLGPLPAQVTNFLEDAAQFTAVYSASLASQPTAAPFQGAANSSIASTASQVQMTGVTAHTDHVLI